MYFCICFLQKRSMNIEFRHACLIQIYAPHAVIPLVKSLRTSKNNQIMDRRYLLKCEVVLCATVRVNITCLYITTATFKYMLK